MTLKLLASQCFTFSAQNLSEWMNPHLSLPLITSRS